MQTLLQRSVLCVCVAAPCPGRQRVEERLPGCLGVVRRLCDEREAGLAVRPPGLGAGSDRQQILLLCSLHYTTRHLSCHLRRYLSPARCHSAPPQRVRQISSTREAEFKELKAIKLIRTAKLTWGEGRKNSAPEVGHTEMAPKCTCPSDKGDGSAAGL